MKAKEKEEEKTYTQALQRLQNIVESLDRNELDIEALSETIKEANGLISICKAKLTKADKEIKKLLEEKIQSEE